MSVHSLPNESLDAQETMATDRLDGDGVIINVVPRRERRTVSVRGRRDTRVVSNGGTWTTWSSQHSNDSDK